MKFLSQAASKALAPHRSVIAQLKKTMGGMEHARDHRTVHASDVTRSTGFCARQICLLDHYDRQRPKQFVPMALRATYDVGEMTGRLVRERWLGDAAVGHWVCERCGEERSFCPKPNVVGTVNGHAHRHDWEYCEVQFYSSSYELSCSIDVLVQLGAPQLTVVEIKIIKPEDFEKLLAPLAEHRLRTNLYLHLIATSESPYKDFVNTAEARVLYVSRAYGKKNLQHGEVMPFKEFTVKHSVDDLLMPLTDGQRVKRYRQSKVFPIGICKTHADPHAKGCVMAAECWSGKHQGVA